MISDGFEKLGREELIELVRVLYGEIAELKQLVTDLRADNAALQRELEKLKPNRRTSGRKGPGKRPGRRPGKGNFTNRKAPENRSGPVDDVLLDSGPCRECGGELLPDGFEEVTITDLPEPVQPVTHTLRLEICRCARCGKRVRALHPDVPADQTGATAHRVGKRAKAMALVFHYQMGIPIRRIPKVLRLVGGLSITHSALVQMALKHGSRKAAVQAYQELRREIAQAPVVHTDDTSWRVGVQPAYVMGFESARSSVYQIRLRHRNDEVREVIGDDFQGVLVCDRGPSYDAKALAGVKQNKCLCHLERSVDKVTQSQPPAAQTVGLEIRRILGKSLVLWKSWKQNEIPPDKYREQGAQLLEQLGHALRPRRLSPSNQTLVDGLRWQMDRGHLLRFLQDPSIAPTNNDAERMLRDIVIARKVSQCSKNENGARTTSIFRSIFRSAARRGMELVNVGADILQGINPFSAPANHPP